MGMSIGAGYGSIGKITIDKPYDNWKKHKEEIELLASEHGVSVSFESQDQGNGGYYLAILNSPISYEHVYQESMFFMDLGVEEDPSFEKKLSSFLDAFWKKESLSGFNNIEFTKETKILFT